MKKTLAIILALVMCSALLFTACSEDSNKLNETTVATVDGVKVSQADYNLMYKLSYDQMAQYSQSYGEGWYNTEIDDKGTTIGAYMKNQAMDSVTELIAIEKLAAENGVKVDKTLLEEQLRNIKEQQGGESGYKEFLESFRTTDEAVRRYIERVMLYENLTAKLTEEGGVAYISDDSVLPEFEEKYLRVQHILVEATFPEDGGDDEEALKKAEEVIKKLNEGASFDSLIEEYNTDPGQTKDSYYTFTDGYMVAEFEEASKNLKVDEYTKEPVKSEFGYHIIKRYELTTDCDEFKNLKNEKAQPIINDIVEKKVKAIKVEKKDDIINKYVDAWLKDLGVNINAPKTPYVAPEMPEAAPEDAAEGEAEAETPAE